MCKARSVLFGVVLAALGLLAGGCVSVPAYQRGFIVQRAMATDPNPPATVLEQHLFEYREGSAGGHPTTGGGCGCN